MPGIINNKTKTKTINKESRLSNGDWKRREKKTCPSDGYITKRTKNYSSASEQFIQGINIKI